jgi:hypothetical protein
MIDYDDYDYDDYDYDDDDYDDDDENDLLELALLSSLESELIFLNSTCITLI